jgi:glycyl-tRNA synthetase beta subunit
LAHINVSFLNSLDTKNFGEHRIQEYFEDTIKFVYDLFVDTVVEDDEETIQVVDSNEVEAAVTVEYYGREGSEINDQELELYNRVQRKVASENVVVVTMQQTMERKRNELLEKIKNMMKVYRVECKKIKMVAYLEENGNDLYKSMVTKKTVDHNRIKFGDALYISKFFDAAKWWMKHESKYPELAMGASILLGKPSHNAFQERVFSRGTYSDTRLRKRLKEEYFEMSVMNAVNNKEIDEIYHIMQPAIMLKEQDRLQEMNSFLEKRKNELDLYSAKENENDDDDLDGKILAEPEYGSVCSVNKEEETFSDDEDDDDMSMINNTHEILFNRKPSSGDFDDAVKLV